MSAAKPSVKVTPRMVALTLVGLVAFLAYILAFQIDLAQVISLALSANPALFALAAAASIAEVLFKAASWQTTLRSIEVKISLTRASLYTWDGIFIDTVIPSQGISGDLTRAYLVDKEQSGTGGQAAASLVIQRILIMALDVATLALGTAFLVGTTQLTSMFYNILILFTIIVALLMSLLLLLSVRADLSIRIIDGLIDAAQFLSRGKWRETLDKAKEYAQNATRDYRSAMHQLGHDPTKLATPTALLALEQVSDLSVSYLVFLALAQNVSLPIIFVTTSVVLAIQIIPTGIPFGIGLPEITMTTFYALTGISPGAAATGTILIRLLTLWLRFAIGFAAQEYIELNQK